ncbi:MAG: hypothetical protein AABY68_06040 [Pseudomonadota bacterium]
MRAELLMARLSARGLVITGGGFGGSIEITRSDVCVGLAGLPAHHAELMRTMFLDDHRGDDLILSKIRAFILARAGVGKITVTADAVSGLAMLALFEVVNPVHCSGCRGHGEVRFRTGVIRACEKCNGSGSGSRSLREQACIAGVDKEVYRLRLQGLATQGFCEVSTWLDDGCRHLLRRMKDAA